MTMDNEELIRDKGEGRGDFTLPSSLFPLTQYLVFLVCFNHE